MALMVPFAERAWLLARVSFKMFNPNSSRGAVETNGLDGAPRGALPAAGACQFRRGPLLVGPPFAGRQNWQQVVLLAANLGRLHISAGGWPDRLGRHFGVRVEAEADDRDCAARHHSWRHLVALPCAHT